MMLPRIFRISEWRGYYGIFIYSFLVSGTIMSIRFLIFNILFFIYMSSIYLANNIYDRDGDRINPNKMNKNPLALVENPSIFKKLLIIELVVAFILGYMLLSPVNYLIYISSLLLGLFYSIPPLRLKERYMLDLLSHAVFFGIGLILIPLDIPTILTNIILIMFVGVYSIILELRNEIEDYEYDKEIGYKTTIVRIGYNKGKNILYMCIMILLFLTIYVFLNTVVKQLILYVMFPILISILYVQKINFKEKMRVLDLYVILFLIMYLFR